MPVALEHKQITSLQLHWHQALDNAKERSVFLAQGELEDMRDFRPHVVLDCFSTPKANPWGSWGGGEKVGPWNRS